MNWPSKIINDINSILLPPLCFGCNVQLSRGEYLLCTICRHDLPLTDFNFIEENPVDRIFYGRVPIVKAISFLYFSDKGMIKNLLHYLKYRNQEKIGAYLGDWFGQEIAKKEHPKIDFILPVPLHPKKKKKRGYNQVELFGKQIATHLNAMYLETILIKTQNTKTQTQKNRLARWKNDQHLFEIKNAEKIESKSILLVDDVITTGATIEACAATLLRIPNVQLYVATMAFVP